MISQQRILELAHKQAKINYIIAQQAFNESKKNYNDIKKFVDIEFEKMYIEEMIENKKYELIDDFLKIIQKCI